MKKIFFLNYAPGDAAPFPIDPVLSGIAVGYENREFIADEVLPKVPVSRLDFKYNIYNLADGFQNIETAVGRKGKPKEIELSASEKSASCVNHALDDPIPFDDIDDAPENYKPVDRAVTTLTKLIQIRREIRVAGIVFNANNYHSSCKKTLTDEWDDKTNGTPIEDLLFGLNAPIMRPNVLSIGQGGWNILRQHPAVVEAVKGYAAAGGLVTKEQLASVLEIDKVVVGKSLYNTSKKGQDVSLSIAWGADYCSLLYIDPFADTRNGITFGFTAQKGNREAGAKEDSNIGAKGGTRVRVMESVKELAIANRAGYLFSNIKS